MDKEQMLSFMEGLDGLRENLSAVVAALVADGFTEDQARWIIVGIHTRHMDGLISREDSDG